jgi:ribosomal protein S18 acetylase RimI-like enzyme
VAVGLGPAFRFMNEADLERDDVAQFACGPAPWDEEVAQCLRSGEAWRFHRPPKKKTFLYCANGGTGQVIGFLNVVGKETPNPLSSEPPTLRTLHMTYFAVGTEHQGHGHGTSMLNTIVRQAELDGFDLIDLFVHEHNERAIRLYHKVGFQFVNGSEFVQGSDRYLKMVRPLRRFVPESGS